MTQEEALKIYEKMVRKEPVSDSERSALDEWAFERFPKKEET